MIIFRAIGRNASKSTILSIHLEFKTLGLSQAKVGDPCL